MLKNFSIISACDQNFGIAKSNLLPWNVPSDLQYFQSTTQNSTVIMGRKTWESLPKTSKPLANRQNIVITSAKDYPLPEGVLLANSIPEALNLATQPQVFVIGGAQLYHQAIQLENCHQVYLTEIQAEFDCDTFFPGEYLQNNFELTSSSEAQEENNQTFYFKIYTKK